MMHKALYVVDKWVNDIKLADKIAKVASEHFGADSFQRLGEDVEWACGKHLAHTIYWYYEMQRQVVPLDSPFHHVEGHTFEELGYCERCNRPH